MIEEMAVRKLVFDIEDVLADIQQNRQMLCDAIRAYRKDGFEIILSAPEELSARQVVLAGDFVQHFSMLTDLCDQLVFRGPSFDGAVLVLDDKAVTPDEFLTLAYAELRELVTPS